MLITSKRCSRFHFFNQMMRIWYLGNYKKGVNFLRVLKRRREKNGVQLDPLMHLSVHTYVTKVLSLPWCPKGFHGTPFKKSTFPPEFCNEICTIYERTQKISILEKKKEKCCTVSKWRPNNQFLFWVIPILVKMLKTTFPEIFFQWNLAQSRTWNNIWKIFVPFQNDGHNKFLILCNNANLC